MTVTLSQVLSPAKQVEAPPCGVLTGGISSPCIAPVLCMSIIAVDVKATDNKVLSPGFYLPADYTILPDTELGSPAGPGAPPIWPCLQP